MTVYTKFGYASVDLEKYKDEMNSSKSECSSPEKLSREDSEKSDHPGVNDGAC